MRLVMLRDVTPTCLPVSLLELHTNQVKCAVGMSDSTKNIRVRQKNAKVNRSTAWNIYTRQKIFIVFSRISRAWLVDGWVVSVLVSRWGPFPWEWRMLRDVGMHAWGERSRVYYYKMITNAQPPGDRLTATGRANTRQGCCFGPTLHISSILQSHFPRHNIFSRRYLTNWCKKRKISHRFTFCVLLPLFKQFVLAHFQHVQVVWPLASNRKDDVCGKFLYS